MSFTNLIRELFTYIHGIPPEHTLMIHEPYVRKRLAPYAELAERAYEDNSWYKVNKESRELKLEYYKDLLTVDLFDGDYDTDLRLKSSRIVRVKKNHIRHLSKIGKVRHLIHPGEKA
jgi:hypothetical protein